MTPSKIELPVLKAWDRVFELLECAGNNEYDRDGFRDAVRELFPGKSEKSVFRGMAIPTLRRLGLIVGYEDVIRLSANGSVALLAYRESPKEGLRALRVIQYEIDAEGIGFIQRLASRSAVLKEDFAKSVGQESVFVDKDGRVLTGSSLRERVNDWLKFLIFSGLIDNEGERLQVSEPTLRQVQNDAKAQSKETFFSENLVLVYQSVVRANYGVGTIDIEELRRAMAKYAYKTESAILTEKQFDELLRKMPKVTAGYMIAFGRPMGKDEKLFKLGDNYYQTITMRFNA